MNTCKGGPNDIMNIYGIFPVKNTKPIEFKKTMNRKSVGQYLFYQVRKLNKSRIDKKNKK